MMQGLKEMYSKIGNVDMLMEKVHKLDEFYPHYNAFVSRVQEIEVSIRRMDDNLS